MAVCCRSARAIHVIFYEGKLGDTYNIGGFKEWKNINIIKLVVKTVGTLLGEPKESSVHLITYVNDRADHDLRYAIDSTKLRKELGWEPSLQFEEGIEKNINGILIIKNSLTMLLQVIIKNIIKICIKVDS